FLYGSSWCLVLRAAVLPLPSAGDAGAWGDAAGEAAATDGEGSGDGLRSGLVARPPHRFAPRGRTAQTLNTGSAGGRTDLSASPPPKPPSALYVLDVSLAVRSLLRSLPAYLLATAALPPRGPVARGVRHPCCQATRLPGLRSGGGEAAGPPATMKVEAGDNSMINLSVQQVLSLWAHGTVLRHLTEMWYWVFLWALFSSLFVHGAVGVLMFVMLQRHRQGRLISVIVVSIGFLGSVTGAMITSAAVAGIYRVAGKNMAPLEALVFGVGQTVLTLIISFSRILATL
uniref:Uncharacterized protein n=5 Tax=Psittaciformes TaxID=9223 RepID=A0A8V5FTH3_MELUD